ncbi:MAG: hypothetical protein QW486_02935 [Candidatus Bathyarchaeia archaeon]
MVGCLPVKVRVRLESLRNSEGIEAPALLNTGFTSETLNIHISLFRLEPLGLWPLPPNAALETLDRAGGETLSYSTRCR